MRSAGASRAFYEKASLRLGMEPSTYRAGGVGSRIDYTVFASPVGMLLVATTDRGLCAVKIGPDGSVLVEGLRREFRRAHLCPAEEELAEVAAAVGALVYGQQPDVSLPLDVRGTAFQARVWEALRRIPPGTTSSYTEVAAAIGAPTAVRAVANACGANPVALVVPCHRVVRGDGSLGGYRWGIEVKAHLLERESGSAGSAPGRGTADGP